MTRGKDILKRRLMVTLIIFMAGVILHKGAHAEQELQLLEATERGVTIQFSPQIERIDTIRLTNEIYYKIYMAHTIFTGNPGEPLIPTKVLNVGIPLDGDATVSILSAETENLSGKLQPVPEIDRSGVYKFGTQSPLYQSSDFYPASVVTTEPPGFIRDQRVLKIGLSAVQFSGASNQIRIYKKIILRIDFRGNATGSTIRNNFNTDDEFYNGVIINYPFSKRWLKPHIQNLKRIQSNLQGENWYKISIRQEGIYKLTGSYLASVGINIESIKTESIRMYNNGGRELPRNLNEPRPDSLIENAIRLVDLDNNGKLNSPDYILFYGKAVNNWEPLEGSRPFYSHYINHYTTDNIYWLTWDNSVTGKRMQEKPSAAQSGKNPGTSFWGLYYNEDEINNYLDSGLIWFGRLIAGTSEQSYSAYLPHPANQENNVYLKFQCLGLTSGMHRFSIYLNNQLLTDFSFSGNRHEMRDVQKTISLSANGYNSFKIRYSGESSGSQAYIDWFEIQYQQQFVAENNLLIFTESADGALKYSLTNFQENQIDVYDISDWSAVRLITNTVLSSGSVTFEETDTGSPRHKYIALTPKAYLIPEKIEPVSFVNLRSTIAGADFIIITHEDFYQAILPLKQHRELHDSLQTEVIKISDIYHEFSWGMFDPTAIRDFVKFAFDNWSPTPKYILLCGDGDYDYKNIKSNLDKNWIPTFQTTELNENVNRTMDEWFTLVSGNDEKPDLAIGRFPVQSAEETQNVVEKILNYETTAFWESDQTDPLDDWRNVITMVGDDEKAGSDSDNETMHTNDAERIIEDYVPDSFNKEKIYLIEYPAVKDPSTSGIMKPEATEALMDRIHKGTLILDYIGHGAPSLWAHERLLKENRDFDRIQNDSRLPFWVAATCDFGRFDDPMGQGFAEKLFTAKGRGGIAFLTSARLAYAIDNAALNREFFAQLFASDQKPTQRLGVALIRAKINNYSTTNDQKYHLFGDPTMRLAAPKYTAKISSIQPDTLKALREIKITGQIQNQNATWSEFQGKALIKIFDSSIEKTYLTKYGSPIKYRAKGKTVFRGALTIREGQFEAKFIVPKDITYGGAMGRVSIYFANEQIQGSGFQDFIKVGGTSFLQDDEGPLVKIGFAGQNFVDGDLVNQNSILEVEIADSLSGVNIAGDIGHNITMVVDDQESDKIMLTDFFNYYEGNFKAGKVRYDFSSYKRSSSDQNNSLLTEYGLPPGNHTITIKAWDNFNNSSVVTASFTVISDGALQLKDVFNFPNPFSSATTFTMVVNQPCQVKIKIFTVSGRLIETLDNLVAEAGINHFYWNGRDREGDDVANGVYLYKIIANTRTNEKTLRDDYVGKLVIAR